MKYAETVNGISILDENGSIVDLFRFPDDPEAIAERINSKNSKEYASAKAKYNLDEKIVIDPIEAIDNAELSMSREALHRKQHDVAMALTHQRIADQESPDTLLVHAVRAIDDIDSTTNKQVERLRSWYSIVFPELDEAIDDHETMARIAMEAKDIEEAANMAGIDTTSTGMDVPEKDITMLSEYGKIIYDSLQYREKLEQYVSDLAEQIVPNLSAVVGSVLAARLVSEAGSLTKLSKMPSSTVQVLGAEKALFRHMRGEGSAPKHGVLFMHRTVRNLPEGKRGKMARFLANKATIAARIDEFDGSFRGQAYRNDVEERFEELREAS